ncbi:hypothetical protein ABZV51_16085 [Streptomyces avermitilis]
MGSDEYACPSCGQPVGTVVRRHKTLGAFVPVWGPAPCRNPRCTAYVPGSGAPAERPAPPEAHPEAPPEAPPAKAP